jgi:hypothetical protein
MFFKGSRYERIGTAELTDADGHVVRYKLTRLIPRTDAEAGHLVDDMERLDHIAFRYYSDPERFWRICDANEALWPPDLVAEPNSIIRIPPSEG